MSIQRNYKLAGVVKPKSKDLVAFYKYTNFQDQRRVEARPDTSSISCTRGNSGLSGYRRMNSLMACKIGITSLHFAHQENSQQGKLIHQIFSRYTIMAFSTWANASE